MNGLPLSTLDAVAAGLLVLAVVRGLAIGVIREAFSLAALAAAVVAVRLFALPVGGWIESTSPVAVGALAARVLAGVGLGLAALLIVGGAGRLLRRGARAVGLGLADRVAGGVLGGAEGALVLALVLLLLAGILGREHPALAGSRAFDVFERAERVARQAPDVVDVAAPPRGALRR